MNRCGSSYAWCHCIEIASRCTFGPDEVGVMLTDVVVPPGQAEGCEPQPCICTSEDNYHAEKASRLELAAEIRKAIEDAEAAEE